MKKSKIIVGFSFALYLGVSSLLNPIVHSKTYIESSDAFIMNYSENTTTLVNDHLRDTSFTVDIFGGGVGSLNGIRLGKEALLKTLIKKARRNVYEFIKNLFAKNKVGKVYVRSGKYISFTPCTRCPWPQPIPSNYRR